MKRKMFSIMAIAAIALTSCKKDEPASSELGEATINGNIWADLNQTDDLDGNGLYIPKLNPEGVEGMAVSVIVNTYFWDQDPVSGYTYDQRVYTTTTDAAGDYTLTIPATEDPYNVSIQYGDVYSTRTYFATDGTSQLTESVKLNKSDETLNIYSGGSFNLKHEAGISSVGGSSTEEYGTATVFGNVYANWNSGLTSTAGNDLCTSSSPLAGKSFSWGYYDSPYGNGGQNIFTTPIAADGSYSIVLPTELANMNEVYIYWGLADFIADQIIQNNAGTADSTATSLYSIGGIEAYDEDDIYDGMMIQQDVYFSVSNL